MKQSIKQCIGEPLIRYTQRFPQTRPRLKKLGLRITEELFGEREVSIPMPAGPPLKLTNLSSNFLSFQLYWRGIDFYEPITLMVFQDLLRNGGPFFDIGANVGLFSLIAAHSHPRLRIIAFEPNPKNFDILRRNVAANRFEEIICESIALSDKNGMAELHLHESDMSASLEPGFQGEMNTRHERVQVPITTLDSYVDSRNRTVPALMKVDVEGHEAAFLNGARATIARHKPDLILEVLEGYSGEHSSFLKDQGYRFYPITDQGFSEADELKRIPAKPFHFLNYVVSARPRDEISAIFRQIQPRVEKLNLYETCKYRGTTT